MKLMQMDESFLNRGVNEGFSGGEKKRNEILQMAVLEPTLALLDETDSGLDIDALRVVANGVNSLRRPDRAIVMVTHYQRLLDYIEPDRVHVLSGGRILKSGDKSLALELEKRGYDWVQAGGGGRMSAVTLQDIAFAGSNATAPRSTRAGTRRRSRSIALRRAALERFLAAGFPTQRQEDWKYTNLRRLEARTFAPAASAPALGAHRPELDRRRRHAHRARQRALDAALSSIERAAARRDACSRSKQWSRARARSSRRVHRADVARTARARSRT